LLKPFFFMVKKIKFSLSHDPDFNLVGISTSTKGFKLAFLINQYLKTNFKRIEDFVWMPEKLETLHNYYVFRHQFQDSDSSLYLVQNRHEQAHLLPVYKQADCFFLTYNISDGIQESAYIQNLKKVPKILAAFKLEIRSGKAISRFIQELEIHVTSTKKPSKH
jgi:hypothetical protein